MNYPSKMTHRGWAGDLSYSQTNDAKTNLKRCWDYKVSVGLVHSFYCT